MDTTQNNNPVQCPPVLEVASAGEITDSQRDLIYQYLTENGFLIIQETECIDPAQSLATMGQYFGPPIYHNMSDSQGVFPMCYMPGYSEYANATSNDVQLHTDGAFESQSPKLLLIHCEQPAVSGGLTQLTSAENVYSHLQNNFSDALSGLFRSDAFSVKRDDRQATNAVFETKDGVIYMTFRSGKDIPISVHAEASKGYSEICSYLADPSNFIEFRLEARQTLILDNTRTLHGRTRFNEKSSRGLYALWCDINPAFSSMFRLGFKSSDQG